MEPISIGPKAMLWGLHLQPVSEISATMILEYDHLFFLFIGGPFAIAYQNLSACSAFESGRFSKSTAENGGYPPTQNGDIRSLFWLFSLMALQN